MKPLLSKLLYALVYASLLSSLAGIQPVYAATNWYVTTTGNDTNSCITTAAPCLTINGAIGKAASGDTIYVAIGTYTGSGTEVVLINKSLTLSGGWDTTFSIQSGATIIDGQGVSRGITVPLGITTTVDTFTVQNGFNAGQGGGIRNNGTLTLNNSIIENNVSYVMGGGIFTFGTLTINDTIIRNNTANGGASSGGGGGGILNYSGTATLNNSTVSNNSLVGFFDGSGIGNFATLILNNSTVSNNTYTPAINFTGSISSFSTSGITINDSTISGNTGVGIYIISGTLSINNSTISDNLYYGVDKNSSYPGVVTIANSIVANNTLNDCSGPITSAGYNLIRNGSGCTFSATIGDIVGTSASPIDPLLGPLQDNGGPTFTQALLAGSTAVDAGNPAAPGSGGNACLSTDQRGVVRPQGTACDIGAYEFDPPPTVTVEQASGQADPTSASPINFTATFSKAIDPTTFTASDLSLGGTALGTLSAVITTSNNIVFNIAVSGMIGSGTVTASLPAGQVADLAGTPNTASTSVDNVVTYTIASTAASSLPSTGFAPNRLTSLPLQTTPYTSLGSIWLEIPSLNVSTNIVGVPHSASGWNVDWLGNDAGWLNGTAFPSWQGNSVITGHVYNASGLPGPFVNLKYLKYGDQIIVHLYGEQYIFQVTATGLFAPHSTAYTLGHLEGHPYLTLITCQQYNPTTDSYTFRRVVRAVLVSVRDQ